MDSNPKFIPAPPPQGPAHPTLLQSSAKKNDIVVNIGRREDSAAVVDVHSNPATGNLFTRFMKTSAGANVTAPMPITTSHNCNSPRDSEKRRQIGVLCNSMPTLDMIELAHKIVPSVTLASPHQHEPQPPRIGDTKYDFKKHAMAMTRAAEREDASLGQRSVVNVVFYQPNPGALTSRREFKLITVPNHRDIEEALDQQQFAKALPKCSNHCSADYEDETSDDEEKEMVSASKAKRKKSNLNKNSRKLSLRQKGSSIVDANASSSSNLLANVTGGLGGNAAGGAVPPSNGSIISQQQKDQGTGGKGDQGGIEGAPQDGSVKSPRTRMIAGVAHRSDCVCVECIYVKNELDRFEKAIDKQTGQFIRGNKKKQNAAGQPNTGATASKKSVDDNASAVNFLCGAAFTVPAPIASQGQTTAPPPLVNEVLVLQEALAWLRALEPRTLRQLRETVLTLYPNLRRDSEANSSARARRMTLAEFLIMMVVPQTIAPLQREGALDRFTLPQRAIYPHHHVSKILNQAIGPEQGGRGSFHGTPNDASMEPDTPGARESSAGSRRESMLIPNGIARCLTPELLAVVRPWEHYFHLFDPERNGFVDRYSILFPILTATSHIVLTEPDALKYSSREYPHGLAVMLQLSLLLSKRRSADGPIRLGEVFAIRDFMTQELKIAKKLSEWELNHYGSHSRQVSNSPRSKQDMSPADAAVNEIRKRVTQQYAKETTLIEEFAKAADDMVMKQELLEGPQLSALLMGLSLI